MKQLLKLITLLLAITGVDNLYAQQEMTFYRTSTSYEDYQLNKIPFAMNKLTIIPKDDSMTIANTTFYKTNLKDGGLIYLTRDRKSYLYAIERKEQVGFIVSPNGKNWSCYFRYKKDRKVGDIPPSDNGREELELLKEALSKIIDPRVKHYHITYSSFASKNNTHFAEDSLPVIFISSDTINVKGFSFIKQKEKLYKNSGRTYLYMPDNETFIFRDSDMTSWASFYQKDRNKANRLISQDYKPEKELKAVNNLIDDVAELKETTILNDYLASLKNQKNDPVIEKTIAKWWNTNESELSPIQKIYILTPMQVITDHGRIVRRTVDAIIVFKYTDGKCYLQWRSFGYEYLGGGVYDKELQSSYRLPNGDYYSRTIGNSSTGSMYMKARENYEVTCDVKR